jgi:hypothetical protein
LVFPARSSDHGLRPTFLPVETTGNMQRRCAPGDRRQSLGEAIRRGYQLVCVAQLEGGVAGVRNDP